MKNFYLDFEKPISDLMDKKIYIEIEKTKYHVKLLEKPLNKKNYKYL